MSTRLGLAGRIMVLALVPLLALGAQAAAALASHLSAATANETASQFSRFGIVATELVHEMQAERSLTAAALSGAANLGTSLEIQRERVTDAVERFSSELMQIDAELRVQLAISSSSLEQLADHRASVDRGDLVSADAAGWYTTVVATILGGLSAFDKELQDSEMVQQTIALRHLSMSKELIDQERTFGGSVVANGLFTDGIEHALYLETRSAALVHREIFLGHATDEQVQSLGQASADARGAEALRAIMRQAHPGESLTISDAEWWSEMSAVINAMRASEVQLGTSLSEIATSRAAEERNAAFRLGLQIAVAVALTSAVSFGVHRSVRSWLIA